MNKRFFQCLLILSICAPGTALGQPDRPGPRGDGPPAERRERGGERGERERGERDRERPGERERRGEREPIPVDLVPAALDVLKQLHPDGAIVERLQRLAEEKPEDAAQHLSRYPRMRELIEMRENNLKEFAMHVEQAKTMRETFQRVREFHIAKRQGDQQAMDKLRPQIREGMERVFDLRIEMKRLEIERMKRELVEAERGVEEVVSKKEEEIDRRMREMLERNWGDRRPRRGEGDGGADRPRPRERRDEPRDERE